MSGRSKGAVGLPQEWIRRKRDGHELTSGELHAFVEGVTSGAVSEAQIAAFAMAVYFQDLSVQERVELTLAVRDSGRVLAWDAQSWVGRWTSTAQAVWGTRCSDARPCRRAGPTCRV